MENMQTSGVAGTHCIQCGCWSFVCSFTHHLFVYNVSVSSRGRVVLGRRAERTAKLATKCVRESPPGAGAGTLVKQTRGDTKTLR